MISTDDLPSLIGAPVLGFDEKKIGTVGQVYVDSISGSPTPTHATTAGSKSQTTVDVPQPLVAWVCLDNLEMGPFIRHPCVAA